jgi:predicted aconitase with swiveling domain
MLGGIATELGGLVSHGNLQFMVHPIQKIIIFLGAVIAREYGLPCIVGAKGATKMFKTGDNVVLSGKTGTIELI